jgi:hypothetical protein
MYEGLKYLGEKELEKLNGKLEILKQPNSDAEHDSNAVCLGIPMWSKAFLGLADIQYREVYPWDCFRNSPSRSASYP